MLFTIYFTVQCFDVLLFYSEPTEVLAQYRTRKHEDSLGETQSKEIILYTDEEEDRMSPVAPNIIVTTHEKQEEVCVV